MSQTKFIKEMHKHCRESLGDDTTAALLVLTSNSPEQMANKIEWLIEHSPQMKVQGQRLVALAQKASDLSEKVEAQAYAINRMNIYIAEMEKRVRQAEEETARTKMATQHLMGFISTKGLLNECLNEARAAGDDV